MDLMVVGSVAYDSVETAAGKRDDMLGGSATHFSLAAALFTQPGLVAVIGQDFRVSDVTLLREHGVDLSGLTTADGPTFRWGGRYHADMNGRDTLFTHLNVFESFQPVLEDIHRDASLVFLANIHPVLQQQVLDQANSPGFVALDTMNLWIDVARDDLLTVLQSVDGL
ncbi:MAG: sugar kinase, partial [Myxococcota bacterium]|nr:sugar kinase [Myxococcota bacterium]